MEVRTVAIPNAVGFSALLDISELDNRSPLTVQATGGAAAGNAYTLWGTNDAAATTVTAATGIRLLDWTGATVQLLAPQPRTRFVMVQRTAAATNGLVCSVLGGVAVAGGEVETVAIPDAVGFSALLEIDDLDIDTPIAVQATGGAAAGDAYTLWGTNDGAAATVTATTGIAYLAWTGAAVQLVDAQPRTRYLMVQRTAASTATLTFAVKGTTAAEGGVPWVQGGNDFGAVGVLGLTDNFALTFITNNVERARITNAGLVGIGTTAPTGIISVTGAPAVINNVTAGGGININTDTTGVLRLDTGAAGLGTGGIAIGTGAAAKAITIGNVTGVTSVAVSTGSGGMSITTTNGGFTVATGTGAIIVGNDATDHNITIGNGSVGVSSVDIFNGTGALNLGTNAIAHGINIGNGIGTTAITIDCGTGALNIGTNATDHAITIGSGIGGSAIVLNAGTAGVNVGTNAVAHTITIGNITGGTAVNVNTGSGGMAITTTNSLFALATGTGAITLGADAAAKTITIGNITLGTAVNINTGTGGSTITTTNGIFTVVTGTGAISIGADAVAHTVTIGNTTGASQLLLRAGSAGIQATTGTAGPISLTTDTTGELIANSGTTGVCNFGTGTGGADANAKTINVGTGAAVKTVVIGSTNTTSSLALNSGTGDMTLTSTDALTTVVTGAMNLSCGGALNVASSGAAFTGSSGGAASMSLTGGTALNLIGFAAAANITMTPGSAGAVTLLPRAAGAGNTTPLRFLELAASGTNFTAITAADAYGSDVTYTLARAQVFAQNTSAQVFADGGGAATVLNWTEVTDNAAAFDPVAGTFTAPATGFYMITAGLQWAATAAAINVTFTVTVAVGGVAQAAQVHENPVAALTATRSAAVHVGLALTAGNVVTITGAVSANGGTDIALTATAVNNYVSIAQCNI